MDILKRLNELRRQHGDWTAHNVEIKTGIFTMGEAFEDRASKRSKTYQALIKRFKSERLRGLKVLDLGCLEGGISIPLAKVGCKCTGVDVRERHLIKATFAAEMLGISQKCKWCKGDVTKKDFWKTIGHYDVIIAPGCFTILMQWI